MPYQKIIQVEEEAHCTMVDDELYMFQSANKEVVLVGVTGWEWVEEEDQQDLPDIWEV